MVEKEFTYTIMNQVSTMGDGGSVGEYALLHGKKRSATVRTIANTHFATMDKEDFEDVMFTIKKKEIDLLVQFLNNYDFLQGLTYSTKAKLGYRVKTKNYVLGEEVFLEDSSDSNIYFIESGQFVLTKELFITKENGQNIIDFRRAYSEKPQEFLKNVFDAETV